MATRQDKQALKKEGRLLTSGESKSTSKEKSNKRFNYYANQRLQGSQQS